MPDTQGPKVERNLARMCSPSWRSLCARAVFNVHRRHLTAEQKRELIAKLLKAQPENSNRAIANATKVVDHKTVGKVRTDMEDRGEIPQSKLAPMPRVASSRRRRRSPTNNRRRSTIIPLPTAI